MIKPAKSLFATGLFAVALVFLSEAFTDFAICRRLGWLRPSGSGSEVARVFDHPITRSQLERAVRERLWLEGKNIGSITRDELNATRLAALDDLIDRELLRAKTRENFTELKVTEEEIDARLKDFSAQFKTPEEMAESMKSQGIANLQILRDRLAAGIQQEKFVESRLAPVVSVSDEEARKWFDENKHHIAMPERIETRHIFIATLDHPENEAKAALESALADLTAKMKDFATLAKELSEDEANKNNGGSLGWMTRSRLPADFATPAFNLPLHQPTLVRSKLGWHLVEVTARKAAETRNFDQAKAEVLAALETTKRRQATMELRKSLRLSAASNITIFHDRLSN